jgi:hypothetical protein
MSNIAQQMTEPRMSISGGDVPPSQVLGSVAGDAEAIADDLKELWDKIGFNNK